MSHFAIPRITVGLVALAALPLLNVYASATWPPVEDGLAFSWVAGSESASAYDNEGKIRLSWEFTPKGRGRLDHNRALVLDCGGFVGEGVGAWIGRSIVESQACTIALNLDPDSGEQSGTILALANDSGIAISQQDGTLRATWTLADTAATVEALIQDHGPLGVSLVITEDRLKLYINGKQLEESANGVPALALKSPELLVGNPSGAAEAGWSGKVEGVAVYARALDPEEIEALSKAYTAQREARDPVDQLHVRARLTGKSTIFTPRDLAPYTQGLCVYRYEILEVLEGDYAEPAIHVAHWMVLDSTLLPFSEAGIGSEHQLTLELLDKNPQLASENLSDDIVEDFSLPYYFDAGGRSTACTAPEN